MPHDLLHLGAEDDAMRANAVEQRPLPHRIAKADEAPIGLVVDHDDEVAERPRCSVDAPSPIGGEEDRAHGRLGINVEGVRDVGKVVDATIDHDGGTKRLIVERLRTVPLVVGAVRERDRSRVPDAPGAAHAMRCG